MKIPIVNELMNCQPPKCMEIRFLCGFEVVKQSLKYFLTMI